MKQKQAICFLICTALLFMNPIIHTSAMDGFDMINNMNMDMILDQSYHTINSVEFTSDHAMDNNLLNFQLDEIMFFPDLLNVINMNIDHSVDDTLLNQDIIVAVDNGTWMPEFNNFFNNPTAEIPIDIEMTNIDMDSITVPAFQPIQDTIRDLNNNPDMDSFNGDPVLNNSAELDFATAPDTLDNLNWNTETNPETALLDVTQPEDNTHMLDAPTAPDTLDNLNWNTETNPETALLDVAQPEDNTHMLDAPGGEILDDGFNNMPADNTPNTDDSIHHKNSISEPQVEYAPPAN